MINISTQKQRIIGLDVGDKAIGVAVSDVSGTVASPLVVIERKKYAAELKKIIADKNPSALLLGLPIGMDGSKGPRYQSVKAFGKTLEKEFGLPILYHDERLSSKAVENMMLEADFSRQRRNELSDKLAAAYILQGYLDIERNK